MKVFKPNLTSIFDFKEEINDKEKEENIAPTEVKYLETTQIIPGKYQPRKKFEEQALKELSISIRHNGVLQPILVREIGEKGKYEIIAGERRFRATQLSNRTSIPCIIVENVTEEQVMGFSLLENIQRENLDPIEEAEAYLRLLYEFNISHDELSKRLGKKRSTITNMLRLNNLNKKVKGFVGEKILSVGHAKLLLPLDEDTQLKVANHIIRKILSVRETEQFLQQDYSFSKRSKHTRRTKIELDKAKEIANKVMEDIQPLISSKNKIQNTKIRQLDKKVKAIELVLSFNDLGSLDCFLQELYERLL